jgi:hypothetical protein
MRELVQAGQTDKAEHRAAYDRLRIQASIEPTEQVENSSFEGSYFREQDLPPHIINCAFTRNRKIKKVALLDIDPSVPIVLYS